MAKEGQYLGLGKCDLVVIIFNLVGGQLDLNFKNLVVDLDSRCLDLHVGSIDLDLVQRDLGNRRLDLYLVQN
jgi:hypothetical protein